MQPNLPPPATATPIPLSTNTQAPQTPLPTAAPLEQDPAVQQALALSLQGTSRNGPTRPIQLFRGAIPPMTKAQLETQKLLEEQGYEPAEAARIARQPPPPQASIPQTPSLSPQPPSTDRLERLERQVENLSKGILNLLQGQATVEPGGSPSNNSCPPTKPLSSPDPLPSDQTTPRTPPTGQPPSDRELASTSPPQTTTWTSDESQIVEHPPSMQEKSADREGVQAVETGPEVEWQNRMRSRILEWTGRKDPARIFKRYFALLGGQQSLGLDSWTASSRAALLQDFKAILADPTFLDQVLTFMRGLPGRKLLTEEVAGPFVSCVAGWLALLRLMFK